MEIETKRSRIVESDKKNQSITSAQQNQRKYEIFTPFETTSLMKREKEEIQISRPIGINQHIFFALEFSSILLVVYTFGFTSNQNLSLKYFAFAAVATLLMLDVLTKLIPSKHQMTEKVIYSKYGGARIGSLYCSWPLARIVFYKNACEIRAFGSHFLVINNSASIKFEKSVGIFCGEDDMDVKILRNGTRFIFQSINAKDLTQARRDLCK